MKRIMKRNTLNFYIDLALFLVLFALLVTGLLIHYVLPPCANCAGGGNAETGELTLWGYGRHDFGRVHFYLGLAAGGLGLLHVCLHWSWVCGTFCNMLGLKDISTARQERYGILILLALMVAVILLLYIAKVQAQQGL